MNKNKILEEINHKLQSIDKNLQKQTSFSRRFLQSIINGVGTAIGASIVAGIAITIIYYLIFSLGNTIPILRYIIPQDSTNTFMNIKQ
jgi:hypothetical protein